MDRKGAYSKLDAGAGALLRALGEPCYADEVAPPEKAVPVHRSVAFVLDLIESG